MVRGRRVGVGAWSVVVAASVSACSILVDTTGLVGRPVADEAGTESGAIDAASDAGVDASTTIDAAPDAFSCEGGVVTTGWGAFEEKHAGLTIEGDVLRASVTTNQPNQTVSSRAVLDPAPVPRRVHIAYDVTLQQVPRFYYEPGCTVLYLASGTRDLVRLLPYVSNMDFGEYANEVHRDGTYELNQRKVGSVSTTPTKHHFEITTVVNGTTLAVDTIVDGSTRHLDLPLFDPVERVVLYCGLVYGSQTSESGTTSTTVEMSKFSASICP